MISVQLVALAVSLSAVGLVVVYRRSRAVGAAAVPITDTNGFLSPSSVLPISNNNNPLNSTSSASGAQANISLGPIERRQALAPPSSSNIALTCPIVDTVANALANGNPVGDEPFTKCGVVDASTANGGFGSHSSLSALSEIGGATFSTSCFLTPPNTTTANAVTLPIGQQQQAARRVPAPLHLTNKAFAVPEFLLNVTATTKVAGRAPLTADAPMRQSLLPLLHILHPLDELAAPQLTLDVEGRVEMILPGDRTVSLPAIRSDRRVAPHGQESSSKQSSKDSEYEMIFHLDLDDDFELVAPLSAHNPGSSAAFTALGPDESARLMRNLGGSEEFFSPSTIASLRAGEEAAAQCGDTDDTTTSFEGISSVNESDIMAMMNSSIVEVPATEKDGVFQVGPSSSGTTRGNLFTGTMLPATTTPFNSPARGEEVAQDVDGMWRRRPLAHAESNTDFEMIPVPVQKKGPRRSSRNRIAGDRD
uniref:Membrane-associated protein n=1 Tax=Mycena chlorophos TaxID=658473 RepID=A0ABQ0L188_MYCCL|nr:predicted protein [Mycena chlorophos]